MVPEDESCRRFPDLPFCAPVKLTFLVEKATIGKTAIKFGADIHVPIRMDCNHFGDPLTFYLELKRPYYAHFWGFIFYSRLLREQIYVL